MGWNAADHRSTGWTVATVHLLLCCLIYMERNLAIGWQSDDALSAIGWFLESAAVAAAMGASVAALARWRIARILLLTLIAVANLYVVIDYAFETAFGASAGLAFETIDLRSLPALVDSALPEITAATTLNLLAWLAGVAITAWSTWWAAIPTATIDSDHPRRFGSRAGAPWAARRLPKRLTGAAALVLVGVLMVGNRAPRHPILAVISAWQASPHALYATALGGPETALDSEDLLMPRFGERSIDRGESRQLSTAEQAIARLRRPNILLITLESVAAVQLLDNGKLRSDLPTLARLAEQGVLFDNIYACAPETLRSQVQLNTGLAMTWDTLPAARFRGPTLAKTFQQAGYRTAYFTPGNLNYAETLRFLPADGYETVVDVNDLSPEQYRAHAVSSWGVADRFIFEQALEWVDQDDRRPFFLQLLTLATHHPYVIENTGDLPTPTTSAQHPQYLAALRQTDANIAQLIAELQQRQLLDNTLLVITGDHGEAFGKIHPHVLIHGQSVFDEAVRSFLLIAAPGRLRAHVTARRVGSVGDIGATVAALASVPTQLPGRNLFSAAWSPQIVYTRHRGGRLNCGLRDGAWKFIVSSSTDDEARLYDLARDPDEQHDLAESSPEKVEVYGDLCRRWHTEATRQYLRARDGNAEAAEIVSGPSRLRFGVGMHELFRPTSHIPWNTPAVVDIDLVPYTHDTNLQFEWRAPSGALRRSTKTFRASESHAMRSFSLTPPEAGEWQLRVQEHERTVAEGTVIVEPQAVAPAEVPGRTRRF